MMLRKLLLTGFLSTFSVAAMSHPEVNLKPLDPGVKSLTASIDDCYQAAAPCLLEVTRQSLFCSKTPVYSVTQYCDMSLMRSLYQTPLKKQMVDNKVVGTKFCEGIVSSSNMALPFTKTDDSIIDVNDGLLLIHFMQERLNEIDQLLDEMETLFYQIAFSEQTEERMQQLNKIFQADIAKIEHIASYSRLANISPFNGSAKEVEIPVDKGAYHISFPFFNLTTGQSGLNIQFDSIATKAEARTVHFFEASSTIAEALSKVNAAKVGLKAAAERNALITSIDMRTENYVVHKSKLSSTKKE